ncbi:MAG: sulfite exporter TauE/SafE family protein, partial [Sulfolobaceae archaeon]|nr:sulfite exporter TauE/SafE family protein [Sulfolobales archaeon]
DTQYQPNYIDHLVIGTTALAVGLNAYINAYMHWRKGNVRVKEGVAFAVVGAVGSFVGAKVGLLAHGAQLLFLFGIFMIAVAAYVWKGGSRNKTASVTGGNPNPQQHGKILWPKLIPTSFAVGFASGFFGIGGGFLIVPGLLFSTEVCMLKAVGTSLISVGTFGVVASGTYMLQGLVDPLISILYLAGGVAGGYIGAKIASSLPRGTLRKVFAVIIVIVAIYLMLKNVDALFQLL